MSGRASNTGEPRIAVGDRIDERFEVEAVLGQGGMGYVVAARHRTLGERVALKLLLPERASPEARRRMVREAQHAVLIKSEHCVRVLDVVDTGPHAPYIVMEFLEGQSVADWLSRVERHPVEDVVEIVVQACHAIGEAHCHGIVHRDLKPSNLLLVARPGERHFVKVLDFGVSKRPAADPAHELTVSQMLVGSPVYAPPEQLRADRHIDGRADIWALGVILYRGLTHEFPFTGATLAEVCTRILQDPPPAPRTLRHDLPEALERTVLRCLEKDPAHRFATVRDLVFALRDHAPATAASCLAYLDALGAPPPVTASEPPVLVSNPADGEPATITSSAVGTVPVVPRRRSIASFALAALLVVGFVGVALILLTTSHPRAPITPTAQPAGPREPQLSTRAPDVASAASPSATTLASASAVASAATSAQPTPEPPVLHSPRRAKPAAHPSATPRKAPLVDSR